MITPAIPEKLVKAIVFLRGEEDGHAWLAALPDRMIRYADRWGLALDSIAEGGAMSCCVFCTTRDGTQAVLKIPVDEPSGLSEIQQLDRWAHSKATPQVLQRADSSGVFLMSRILPGTTAWATGGPDDSRRFGDLITRLTAPHLPVAPRLDDMAAVADMRLGWALDRFKDPAYADFAPLLRAAERTLRDLLKSTTTRHVLHADLQAKNIIVGPSHWYAIDPMGATGDINAEAALWAAVQDGPTSTTERLDQLSPHPLLDPPRLHAWTYFFSAVELRLHLKHSADRMIDFLTQTDPTELTC